jgi:type III restriction enzyme
MQEHYWERATGYEVRVSKGFTELKRRAYTQAAGEPVRDFRQSPPDKSDMPRYLFTGFQRCLYAEEKFQSDPERKLAIILDREALRWFRPAKGQFQLFYRKGADPQEYQPDFVAETNEAIYMIEAKRRSELATDEVEAKKAVGVQWCRHASQHAATNGGKPWQYVLIPHDIIAENMALERLAKQYVV